MKIIEMSRAESGPVDSNIINESVYKNSTEKGISLLDKALDKLESFQKMKSVLLKHAEEQHCEHSIKQIAAEAFSE